ADDIAGVAAIERDSFGDPWSERSFQELLGTRSAIFLVATRADAKMILGYIVAMVVAEQAEILNLAVAPSVRRQGLGGELLDAGIAAVSALGAREAFLEVRESNKSALGLYGSRGFAALARRSRYYRNPVEDALVLRLAVER
ncbi:MAG TPA: ribosomal protein S18-alanine N-acetyltransferase, partial [Gemmatimonadaceae bacterium]